MGNAGGHLPDGGQFACLHQFILGTAQRVFSLAPFANLALEPFVAGAQVGSAFGDLAFQLVVGLLQGFACGQAGGDYFAPLVPGNQQKGQQGKGHRHQGSLIRRFTAQVLQGGEQGDVPGGVVKPAGLRQVADFLVVGHHFAAAGEGDFFDTVGQVFPLQRLQLVKWPPVILQAAGQALLGVGAERAD